MRAILQNCGAELTFPNQTQRKTVAPDKSVSPGDFRFGGGDFEFGLSVGFESATFTVRCLHRFENVFLKREVSTGGSLPEPAIPGFGKVLEGRDQSWKQCLAFLKHVLRWVEKSQIIASVCNLYPSFQPSDFTSTDRRLHPFASVTHIQTNVDDAPVRHGEEWANALTHGFAAISSVLLGYWLIRDAIDLRIGLGVACAVYVVSACATFTFSTLSHTIHRQPTLNTLRAWDQAMIYCMISGTYTPIIYRYASEALRAPLLIAIWVAAMTGLSAKLLLRHRINNITTIGYLLLGWLPSIPLYGNVPTELGWGMLLGGLLYSLGVVVLINDSKREYLHALWHLLVMSAALTHFLSISWYVVKGTL